MPETYREQWQAAAAVLRAHADKFDETARTAPPRPSLQNHLVHLLHEVDGHLGLAVHRGEHDQRWKDEAQQLISRIREQIALIDGVDRG